jgi:hypothetical protein
MTSNFVQAAAPVFPAGYAPFQFDMNNWIAATLGWCSYLPVFRGQQQAGQPLSSSSVLNALALGGTAGDILEDPYGGWSHTATSAQPANSYLVPYTGWYEVTITILCVQQAMFLEAAVGVSGGTPEYVSNVATPAAVAGGCSGSLIVPATGGLDYIQAGAVVSAAATTDAASAGLQSSLEITYVSSG